MSRPGFKAVEFPPGAERIVSMINFKDRILVATDAGVYEMHDGALYRLKFLEADPATPEYDRGA